MGTLQEDELSIEHTERLHAIEEQSDSIASADRAVVLDRETAALVGQIGGLGTLMHLDALQVNEHSEHVETYIKYAGYSLSILGIFIAAVAQLKGKGA